MKVKLTASCIWTPVDNENDKDIVQRLLKEKPADVILDYLEDALRGDGDMSSFEVSAEEIND